MSRGFSFLEISVVLSITGLLLAAIIAGTHMLEAARLNSVITDMAQIKSAVEGFEIKYTALPGDMPDASSFWSINCTDTGGSPDNPCNGDGDRRIEYNLSGGSEQFEDLRAWQHLSLSEYYPADLSGLVSGNRFALGSNAPESDLQGVGFWIMRPIASLYGTSGNLIMAGRINGTTGLLDAAAFTVSHAHALDIKVDDDGDPDSGDLYVGRGSDVSNNRCTNGAAPTGEFTQSSAAFLFSDLAVSCVVAYWLSKD